MAQSPQHHYESAHAPTWCPGCGNFAIWTALKKALVTLGIPPHKVLIVYGIGCSGNMANTLGTYGWHSLHGRAVPTGVGAKLANDDLTVIVAGGDGDGYGEGLSHFIHAVRGNADITYLVHNNSIYGLTTGQSSPTSHKGFESKSTPDGLIEQPLNPLGLALTTGGNFIARGFSGDTDHLSDLMVQAIQHRGFSHIDIFQPCVTFNKVDTYQHYNGLIEKLEEPAYKANNRQKAIEKALRTDKLAIGLLYKAETGMSYVDELRHLNGKPLVSKPAARRDVTKLYKDFI